MPEDCGSCPLKKLLGELIDVPIGEQLRRARRIHGLSQEKVEAALDMCKGHMSRLENGHYNGHVSTLQKLATLFNEPVIIAPKHGLVLRKRCGPRRRK